MKINREVTYATEEAAFSEQELLTLLCESIYSSTHSAESELSDAAVA